MLLYLATLLIEMVSITARFGLVMLLAGAIWGPQVGGSVGLLAALGPPVYSLLVLLGLPSGHLLVRRSLGARELSRGEVQTVDCALDLLACLGAPRPLRIYTIDADGLNAAVAGRTLYIYRDLYRSHLLTAVLAHELGHYRSLDSRLLLAIHGLTVPGSPLIAAALLAALGWLSRLADLLIRVISAISYVVLRVRLSWLRVVVGWLLGLAQILVIVAFGGLGTTLLRGLWRSHLRQRELAADAYAADLGFARELIAFFELAPLDDMSLPWEATPTHPPTGERIAALRAQIRRPAAGPAGNMRRGRRGVSVGS